MILNTPKLSASARAAEIKRLMKRRAVLLERKRVLEQLIAEQAVKTQPPSQ